MAALSMRQCLKGIRRACGSEATSRNRNRCRLNFECLESRWLPSTVYNLNDAGPGSLRDAIADSPDGGTVHFRSGLTGTITLTSGELLIAKDLTIVGPGADVIAVSGNHAGRVIGIDATVAVAISGLSIADGNAGYSNGGGITNAGTLTLTDSNVIDNSSQDDGTAIWSSGTLAVTNSAFSGNSGSGALAIIGSSGTLTLGESTFDNNQSFEGIGNTGMATITDCRFNASGNIANGGMLTLTNSTVSGNSIGARGGGISNGGPATVIGCTISGNSATSEGGGISNGGSLIISNSTISGNHARFDGGGIFNWPSGTVNIMSSTITTNYGVAG